MSLITQAGSAATSRFLPRSQPNCTHIRVDRLYGDYLCDLCRYHSALGWVYQCTADVPEVGDYQFLKSFTHPVSPLGEELRQAGLSESVIKQAEQGVYTTEQLRLLKEQKAHLIQTIDSASPPHSQSRKASRSSRGSAHCDFKVCHHCRPTFKDRSFMSFGAIFEDEVRPVDKYEMLDLPLKDARVAKTLGLRPPVLDGNLSVIAQGSESPGDYSPGSNCTTDGYSDSSTEQNREEYSWDRNQQESWTDARTDEAWTSFREAPYPTVGPFVTSRDYTTFQIPEPIYRPSAAPRQLRRISRKITDYSPARSKKTSFSSVSLPDTRTTYTTPTEDADTIQTDPGCYSDFSNAQTFTLNYGQSHSRSSSITRIGIEIEVEGGFALTEDAVRTGTPDLFLDV